MDTTQLLSILSDQSNVLFDHKTGKDLELLAAKFPYFAGIHFANFAHNQAPTTATIAKLALFKGDPYLFASFVINRQQAVMPSEEKNIEEDILRLINDLPNTNPIAITKENKQIPTQVKAEILPDPVEVHSNINEKEEDKSLMVMMSFNDWLFHFKTKTEREKQEDKEKKALRTTWQKEKLAAATEEENEEIPEEIFKLAMNSISENTIISESLAIVLAKQGKIDKAVDMYKKLSLRNPEKNRYFADRIKELTTIKDY
jgi:hypothetical protein